MTTASRTPSRIRTMDLARVAVFVGVIAGLGLPGAFMVFGGVPITAQTLGVMLAGGILGARLGALSVATFLALVAAGLPLLAGGRGGAAVFLSPTAGYAIGWIAAAFVIGAITHASGRRPIWWRTFLGMVVGGVLVIYAFGIPVQSALTHLPLGETVLASLVFLPGDLTKAVIATLVIGTLVRAYPRAFARTWRTSPASVAAPSGVR